MIKPLIWIEAGIIILYGSSIDAAPHAHHALQVVWPKRESICKLNGNGVAESLIIGSNIEHQLQMSEGWVLLIEPRSRLGIELATRLDGNPYTSLKSFFNASFEKPIQYENVNELLTPLLQQLNIGKLSITTNKSSVADIRIQQLIDKLDRCLLGDCIKPVNWRASEVSSFLSLSESRFLHLFSQEMGIAWRPFLLWRRMMCAVRAILNNTPATEAAYLAGFSDSAHLSRTFRKNFGMTIRQAKALFKKG